MQRNENQPPKQTAGFPSVPLFNQKKRNRVPLTSAPSENEFFSHTQYVASTSPAASYNTAGVYGGYQASGPSSGAPQCNQWNRQSTSESAQLQHYGSNRPAPGATPTKRIYSSMTHPYKAESTCFKINQPRNQVRPHAFSSSVKPVESKYQVSHSSDSAETKPIPISGYHTNQQSSYRMPTPTHPYFRLPRPLPPPIPLSSSPSPCAVQPQNNCWKFTNSFQSKTTLDSSTTTQSVQLIQKEKNSAKPAETSLRILTAVIGGMRHWSKFKDKVPALFEIFATLDSAVTLGQHGAKSFLMRDGKEVVQCIFYENEQELPRLIRGQMHRCVGNYDRNRDVLVCVSIRPGLPSELRNAQEAVRACDAEMRALIKSFSED